ncbi:asparaginase domain-containing protein [Celeribacter indicus]|uniref:Asparaginase n=1 Tax=Celeribacter indicus TaxID=1208324 RepID=A0A0B5E0L6_9RHOB|nr:asparaginase domain-containing protein [Celeribacter indicus]AJE48804.1 asparaginase [Celeribacter indicus]SDW37837.1 L-asparaginase [Celeribacter indicus]
MKDVRIIVTGGTIDKVHDMQGEGLGFAPSGASHIPLLLEQARCFFPKVQEILLKDSLDFDEADRAAILFAVRNAPETAIVVTHGTGTIGRTARELAGQVTGKTVVLTGAMRPFSFGASDGPFNLGGAVIAAQHLPEGVWGVMNGRVFAAEALDKNTGTGRFDT